MLPSEDPSLKAPQVESRRARALLPNTKTYEIAPKSRVLSGRPHQYVKPISAGSDDFIKRIKAKGSQGRKA